MNRPVMRSMLLFSLLFAVVGAGGPAESASSGDPSERAASSTDSSFSRAAMTASCVEDDVTLCLNDGRFAVRIEWTDFEANSGSGRTVPFVSDSGLAYFFDPGNIELLIKVLDGCAINDHFWVFFAATTNVGFTVEVTDTVSGEIRTYTNPLGQRADAVADTAAFAACAVGASGSPNRPLLDASTGALGTGDVSRGFFGQPLRAWRGRSRTSSRTPDSLFEGPAGGSCTAGPTTLCLNRGRFEVEVDWRDFRDNRGAGLSTEIPDSGDSGLFYFFDPDNLELLIKVLDGCGLNDRFWVFFAATTTVELTVTVTDTLTGEVKVYTNPLGKLAEAVTDTAAFDTCDGEEIPPEVVFLAEDESQVSVLVPLTGGVVETTANDGTVYRLELGPGALAEAEQITLTPLQASSSILDQDLTAVRLGPDGLRLLEPAVLTIEFPSPTSVDPQVGFVTDDDGRGFRLVPSQSDGLSATLSLPHFSSAGFGGNSGGLEDLLIDLNIAAGNICSQLTSLGTSGGLTGEALARHRLAILAAVIDFCTSIDLFDFGASVLELAEILRDWFTAAVLPLVERAEGEPDAVLKLAISRTNAWLWEFTHGALVNEFSNFGTDVELIELPPFSCGSGAEPCLDLADAQIAAVIPILRGIKNIIVNADQRCLASGDDNDREALEWIDLGQYLSDDGPPAYDTSDEWERDPDPLVKIKIFKTCGVDELFWDIGEGDRAYLGKDEMVTLEIKAKNRAGQELALTDPLYRNVRASVIVNQQVVAVDGVGGGQEVPQRIGNGLAQLTGLGAGQEEVDAGLFLERTLFQFYTKRLPVTVFDLNGAWRVETSSTDNECNPSAPLPPAENVEVMLDMKTLSIEQMAFGATLSGDLSQQTISTPPSFLLGPAHSTESTDCDAFFADVCTWVEAGAGCEVTAQSCEEWQAIEGTVEEDGLSVTGRWGREVEVTYLVTSDEPPTQVEVSCEVIDEIEATKQ